MITLNEINSMEQVRDIITELTQSLTYFSPNKEIVVRMVSDFMELIMAYVIFGEKRDREIIAELSNAQPEPNWNSIYDVLVALPIAGHFSKFEDPEFFENRKIKNEFTKNVFGLTNSINELVLSADYDLDDSKYPDSLLLSAFYGSERICNILPLCEYENELITEFKFALMEIAKAINHLEVE